MVQALFHFFYPVGYSLLLTGPPHHLVLVLMFTMALTDTLLAYLSVSHVVLGFYFLQVSTLPLFKTGMAVPDPVDGALLFFSSERYVGWNLTLG